MPSDEQALLSAIWADPHDDLPRLVYADWLEETGVRLSRARAELIRVQCALERADDAAERRALRERENRLLKSNRQAFTKGASGMVRRAEFLRGFPYPLLTHPSRLLPLQSARLAEAPLWFVEIQIPFSRLEDLFPRKALFSLPEWERVGRLTFRRDAELWLPEFLDCRHIGNLSWLDVTGRHGIGAEQLLARISRTESLRRLRSLQWAEMTVMESGIRDLAHGPLAGRLSRLGLHATGLTDRLFRMMSESPLREGLRELSIREQAMGDSVVQQLTCNGWKLQQLEIVQSNLTDTGLERLAAWPGLADIEYLNLGRNSFGPVGGRALAASPYLKCSPHCSIRMSGEATGQEWADLQGPLGANASLFCST